VDGYPLGVLTAFGVTALTFMMVAYALERRDRRMVIAFAVGCALSSTYGFLSGAWAFGVVEAIWTIVALHRSGSLGSSKWARRTRVGRAG
jgi:hypothetical protein